MPSRRVEKKVPNAAQEVPVAATAPELTAVAPAKPEPCVIFGFVEDSMEIDGKQSIKGWAIDRAAPMRFVSLGVFVDGEMIAETLCNVAREDLLLNGLPRATCGFIWPIPPQFLDGRPHQLALRGPDGAPLASISDFASDAASWPRPAGSVRDVPPTRPQQDSLFDANYYLATNPDIAESGCDPWEHFLQKGAAEGRNPNLLFDVGHYARANPDVAATGQNPLLHYAAAGRAENRSFHWLFSPTSYLRFNPDLVNEPDLLAHMLYHGLRENRRPHSLFDPAFYLSAYQDVAAAGMSAFGHFLISGDSEGRAPNAMFDPGYYRRSAGLMPGVSPLRHYVESGGRADPHALFASGFYRSQSGASGTSTPLQHYIEDGGPAGIDPHPAFDTAHYLRQADSASARACPLGHYLLEGRQRGYSPSTLFDPAAYVAQSVNRTWDGKPLPRTGPRITVIVPVYNTPPDILRQCIESVRTQLYANWELSIIDDCSKDPGTAAMLASYRGLDPRIRIERSLTNLHIAGATNRAVLQATGEFVAFLDHDDVLEPEALAEVAAAVMDDPEIDLLYTDEDKLDQDGIRTEPYHKPGWSPDHLHSVMYLLHMLTVRKSLFWAVGGSRPERTGAQDYDLALRLAPLARRVHHIPRILYHWRILSGSAAGDVMAKPYAIDAGRAALQDAVDAAGLDATVVDGLLRGTFRVRPRLADQPPVSLLILTHDIERELEGRGSVNLVRNFMQSIAEKSTYKPAQIVVVDDCNSSAETKKLAKQLGARIVSYKSPGPFNYAHKANFAVRAATTENVVILNDDLEVLSPDWIEALLELSTQENVGGVGARLLYPSGRIQHAGIVLGVQGATAHAFHNLEQDVVGYNAFTHIIRNYSAVTGAVFASRKAVLAEVGGFDERFAIDYNDVDLCLRIGATGRRIVYTPFCELLHYEGSSAKRKEPNPAERALFIERWARLIHHDPFYNPNLPRDRTGFA